MTISGNGPLPAEDVPNGALGLAENGSSYYREIDPVQRRKIQEEGRRFIELTGGGTCLVLIGRLIGVGDSTPVGYAQFKVYLLRVSTLQPRAGSFALGWKQSPRGAVDGARPEDSTPVFAEMAAPGSSFEGDWQEKTFFTQPEIRRAIRWQESFDRGHIFEAANEYAARLLAIHKQYASWTGLNLLVRQIDELERRLAEARTAGECLISVGWAGRLLGKSAWLDTTNADYRQILEQYQIYNRALATNLPFPKTRRIVFIGNRPATLPGWVELTVEG